MDEKQLLQQQFLLNQQQLLIKQQHEKLLLGDPSVQMNRMPINMMQTQSMFTPQMINQVLPQQMNILGSSGSNRTAMSNHPSSFRNPAHNTLRTSGHTSLDMGSSASTAVEYPSSIVSQFNYSTIETVFQ